MGHLLWHCPTSVFNGKGEAVRWRSRKLLNDCFYFHKVDTHIGSLKDGNLLYMNTREYKFIYFSSM